MRRFNSLERRASERAHGALTVIQNQMKPAFRNEGGFFLFKMDGSSFGMKFAS